MRQFLLVALLISVLQMQAQSNIGLDIKAQIDNYYRQAMKYKNGIDVLMDYGKAVDYFRMASDLGDAQSIYSLAYMKYKGLGCEQDYKGAAKMFAQGAFAGRDNSMYFYALCWRNGYGLPENQDSALYWLRKDSVLGYRQARMELAMKTGENSNTNAKGLVEQIKNAALPEDATPNKFKKITNHVLPAEIVAGSYTGWVIQYDWSGQNIVNAKKLILYLAREGENLLGSWTEEGNDSIKLNAFLRSDSIVFNSVHFDRKDHYSPNKGVRYNLQNAVLNLVQKADTVFLVGNVAMFSSERGEPSKPILLALSRVDNQSKYDDIRLKISPNPFISTLNVEFTIRENDNVEVELLSSSGAIIYKNQAGWLTAGHYLLPLKPNYISPGIYLVKISYGKSICVMKVVKE